MTRSGETKLPRTGKADSARSAALAFLDERNAASVEHLQGTLLEHLLAVENLLRVWGSTEDLALAGLCHATYGTDGFAPFLLELGERSRLQEVIGTQAEEAVYFYASCDRTVVYPRLAADQVRYSDRFTGTEFDATAAQMRDFVDLTVANEVEIAVSAGNPTEWTWLATFCAKTQHLASPPVFAGAAGVARNRVTEPLLEGLVFGESVRWHDGRVWVCDWGTGEAIVLEADGTARPVVALGTYPVCIDWLPDGRLLAVAGGDARVMRLEPSGDLVVHAELAEVSSERWNEVVVGAEGTAYVNGGGGSVVVIDPDGSVRQVIDEVAFPNGMAVSQDQKTLIVAESHANLLSAFDIGEGGELSGRRVWAHAGNGVPDGICFDADGALWYADVPNRCCVRVAEGGTELARIEVDRGCFSCALGERDGPALFIAATEWRGFEAMFEGPPNGQLLAVGVEVSGFSA